MLDETQALMEQATARHQAGELSAAESLYRQILTREPTHVDTQYLLGTVLLQLGSFDECIKLLQQVAQARPDVPDIHNNLGVALKASGDWQAAAQSFQAALRADPDYQQAVYNLGRLMEERGLVADAAKCYRRSLAIDPNDNASRLALANAYRQQQDWSDAEQNYRELISRDREHLDAQASLGFVLARQEKLAEAADVYRRIVEQQPDFHQIHSSLSYVYERTGQLQLAVDSANRATEINPDYAEGYNNLGNALRSQHRLDAACTAFEKAIDLSPDFALAEFNLATTRLLAGRYLEGWEGYARHQDALGVAPRQFTQPRWNGESIPGRTLLIYSDQGFGDTLQFARFLEEIERRSQAQLILECQAPLVELLNASFPDVNVVSEGSPARFDQQISLSAIPELLAVDEAALEGRVPYLKAAKQLSPAVQRLVDSCADERPRVGIVWRGNPEQARDIVRSCPIEELSPLVDINRCHWISLQTGLEGEAFRELPSDRRPTDAGSHLVTFAETASLIDRLDLVITVDTATAHLAGALGASVWTMLCHTPDWRWELDRSDSTWYPSMRLFRQPEWGRWDYVVEEVGVALNDLLARI